MVVHRLLTVLLGMSAFGGAVSAQVESTGFEVLDGWDAGYSICGPEFAATCSYPVTNVCVPGDHAASQNCCSGDPNEDTGWYMSNASKHCNEPHIETANPFSGAQHLRFERDPDAEGSASAFSPPFPNSSEDRTVISFELAGSNLGISQFRISDVPMVLRFHSTGSILIDNFVFNGLSYVGNWIPGVYRNVTIDFDHDSDTVAYCYDGHPLLVSSCGTNKCRTSQRAGLSADNLGGVWDIDDLSIRRSPDAAPGCGELVKDCGPEKPCAMLWGVAINGNPIPPSGNVFARPGDILETEIRLSGWTGSFPSLRIYQAQLSLAFGALSGRSGTVLPLGWDAPVLAQLCTTNVDCHDPYPLCSLAHDPNHCVGPNHDPESGAFITTEHPDFVFFGLPGYYFLSTALLDYTFAGIMDDSAGVRYQGEPAYAGTLLLEASDDACGSFTFTFDEDVTLLADTSHPSIDISPWRRSLQIHVCEDDGLFCNGVESCNAVNGCQITPPPDCDDGNACTEDSCDEAADACAHAVVCGACCDQWIGECQDAVAQADCSCPNCTWTGGAECADIECKGEFVVIPTVSQWGLVVLTLLLLNGGKVMFSRRTANLSSSPTF